MKDNRIFAGLAFSAIALVLVTGGFFLGANFKGCTPEPQPVVVPDVPEKPAPDQVVYVYEQRDGSVPPAIAAALDKLNRVGIDASPFEDDSTDGDGDVPEQYKTALDAARLAGLPALVVLGKGEVLTIANGGTEVETIEELLAAKSAGVGCPDTCYGPNGCDCHLKEGGCQCGDDRRNDLETFGSGGDPRVDGDLDRADPNYPRNK